MRLLKLPVELPLKVAGAATRTAFQVGGAVVGRVRGGGDGASASQPAAPTSPTPSSAPAATPKPASSTRQTPRTAGGAGGATGRASSGGGGGATGRASSQGGGGTTRARGGAASSSARTKTRATTPRARKAAGEPSQPLPEPPPEAAPQAVPHDPPDGTRVDSVPTGATPASPTAPADESDLVASFGPERDAGAQIHVEAPFEGYDKLGAADIVDRLKAADPATRAAVALYEGQGKKRKSVLAAAAATD